MKTNRINYIIFCFILLFNSTTTYAQIAINFIQPFAFSSACASNGFNTYTVRFTVSPIANIQAGNQFQLELSDATGSFANPVNVGAPSTAATSTITISFSLPITVSGEGYKLRVRSSAPATQSAPSNAFPAYYRVHDIDFKINNGLSAVAICTGGSFTLSIDNPNNNTSPVFYPQLTYNWYKNNVEITGQTGPSLTVTQLGDYYVETNYGSCSPSASQSQIVAVSTASAASLTITNSGSDFICQGDSSLLVSNFTSNPGYEFQWYNGTTIINGATTDNYEATGPGVYKLVLNTGTCTLESNAITIGLTPINATLNLPSPTIISAGQTIVLEVTTDVTNPVFEWFINDQPVTSTGNTFAATRAGEYKVIVRQTAGCVTSKELTIKLEKPASDLIPNFVSANADGYNDTWDLPSTILSKSNIEVKILNNLGKLIYTNSNYKNTWPEDLSIIPNTNPVFYYIISENNNTISQGSITVIK
ncbi:MAG TPA: gliding motility-associated C-terminal domain-containing protein [Flavobacterium sp.]|jgi:gliding motility-associated-like protein